MKKIFLITYSAVVGISGVLYYSQINKADFFKILSHCIRGYLLFGVICLFMVLFLLLFFLLLCHLKKSKSKLELTQKMLIEVTNEPVSFILTIYFLLPLFWGYICFDKVIGNLALLVFVPMILYLIIKIIINQKSKN